MIRLPVTALYRVMGLDGCDLERRPTVNRVSVVALYGERGLKGASRPGTIIVSTPSPPSFGPSPSFLHTQSSPATTWAVNHNLGTKPAVEVRTVGGTVVIADVQHVSVNQCVIYLAAAMAGTAFCTL